MTTVAVREEDGTLSLYRAASHVAIGGRAWVALGPMLAEELADMAAARAAALALLETHGALAAGEWERVRDGQARRREGE